MIKNDEDYLIRRTYTNYGGRKMSADEMFEKLGTNKIDNCDFCVYEGKVNKFSRILFNKVEKSIIFEGFNAIRMQELQAINKKVEELGWNE